MLLQNLVVKRSWRMSLKQPFSGYSKGEDVFILWIPFTPSTSDTHFSFRRFQSFICTMFGMLINKLQSYTLSRAGIHLEESHFLHAPDLGGKTICSHSSIVVQLRILSTTRFYGLTPAPRSFFINTACCKARHKQCKHLIFCIYVLFCMSNMTAFVKDVQPK